LLQLLLLLLLACSQQQLLEVQVGQGPRALLLLLHSCCLQPVALLAAAYHLQDTHCHTI
jgi:hypothetical protein